ncbi:SAM-dependent methyltransferase, type 11 [Desulfonema limicola]|uniref:SAM-dependent methyltransferase, type 11 n=1 Tax=Desulfonema limicola TaxID=45656 RepID=A0A975GH98_9BACT|nr:methyltransferase domain-containing protein [Desulfonema limicola]QTA81191.1 SAM-dependent methyltransferase, type 11 [Desulfonema limicola]
MPQCYDRRINLLKLTHFKRLKPVCPVCRRNSGIDSPLETGKTEEQINGDIIQGILVCTNRQCLSEFPVIDGIPVIVADLRAYISQQILPVIARNNLHPSIESLIGDCCGPGSAYDIMRQHLSTYTFDHYGDIDPLECGSLPGSHHFVPPGSVRTLLQKGLEHAGTLLDKPFIDTGCAVGRTCFDLAEKTQDIVLGIDLSFAMLQTASRILRTGIVSYPRRAAGIVYHSREFPAHFTCTENIDFWACDAAALPFADNTFGFAASINLIDCVHSPYDHLLSLKKVLMPDAKAILASPYDWSPGAASVESWLGGHSQRSDNQGASEIIIKSLLTKGCIQEDSGGFEIIFEIESLPWSVRIHDRSAMSYLTHLLVLRRV